MGERDGSHTHLVSVTCVAAALETDDGLTFPTPEVRTTRLVKRSAFEALKRDHDAMLENLTATQKRCTELVHAERVARKALSLAAKGYPRRDGTSSDDVRDQLLAWAREELSK